MGPRPPPVATSWSPAHQHKKVHSMDVCFDFVKKTDFLGRLQPSKTTTQKTRGTLRVEESSYPRKASHFYSSNSSRGRMRAELWRYFGYGESLKKDLGPKCLEEKLLEDMEASGDDLWDVAAGMTRSSRRSSCSTTSRRATRSGRDRRLLGR